VTEQKTTRDRTSILAHIAEMYYLEGKTQDEIAGTVGVTRSMISRMLTEARSKGIVEVRIRRPIQYDDHLEALVRDHFHLMNACVADLGSQGNDQLLKSLGTAGAAMIKQYLGFETVLGIAWGTTISAVVEAIEYPQTLPLKIIQLVGALGSKLDAYNGLGLVQRLTQKLGGEGYFINAPFICPNPETALALREAPGIRDVLQMGKEANVALLGVGSTQPEYSSFYLAGYVPLEDLEELKNEGAVGDVCGLNFDVNGGEICGTFCERLITIPKEFLFSIPIRIGVAGGLGKVQPLLGALRGGYINVLVTDDQACRKLLEIEGVI
jgi:DNA-binding transcriptional regulator LsrR (DeoR family)